MVQDGAEGVAGMSGMALLEEAAAAKAEAISTKARTGAPKLQLPHRQACSRPHKVPLLVRWSAVECLLSPTLFRDQVSRSSACLVLCWSCCCWCPTLSLYHPFSFCLS